MANLVLNGKSIDCIDEIAENFVEEDVVAAFRSGLLVAWLEEYGYEEELERVRSIKPNASSIMVLAGIIEALKLNDEVVARANAKREEQKRREELARKAREERQRQEEEEKRGEGNKDRTMQDQEYKDDIPMYGEETPSYVECVSGIHNSSDIETARDAVRIIIKWYADKFIEDILRADANRININIFAWCMLFGCDKCSPVLRRRCDVWLRQSPGMWGVRLRVGMVGGTGLWLYDGLVSDLKLDAQSLASFWSACTESMNLGQDKYMAPAVDYYVTNAIVKYFQWQLV